MELIPCPQCNGKGCDNCRDMGYLGKENGSTYYVSLDANNAPIKGDLKSGAVKNSGFGIFALIVRQLQEPHDFIWFAKQKLRKR